MDLKPTPTSPKLKKTDELEQLYRDKSLTHLHRPPQQKGYAVAVVLAIILGAGAGYAGAWYYSTYQAVNTNTASTIVNVPSTNKSLGQKRLELTANIGQSAIGIFEAKDTTSVTDPLATVYPAADQLSTGLIVTSDGWAIVPKWAVPDLKKKYVGVTNDGQTYELTEVLADPALPMYFVKLDGKNFSTTDFIDQDKIAALGEVLLLKHNNGQDVGLGVSWIVGPHVLTGATAKDLLLSTESIATRVQVQQTFTQTDQGTIVLTPDGVVVGIVASDIWPTNLIIPASAMRSGVTSLLKNGEVDRAQLGIHYLDLRSASTVTSYFSQGQKDGAYIFGDVSTNQPAVESGSPAEIAGLKKGDIITQINDAKIQTEISLTDAVQNLSPGDTATLKLLRDGKSMTVNAKLGSIK